MKNLQVGKTVSGVFTSVLNTKQTDRGVATFGHALVTEAEQIKTVMVTGKNKYTQNQRFAGEVTDIRNGRVHIKIG